MNHIDEHQLELFMLHPEALGTALAEIQDHLKECSGCARLAQDIRSYYQQFEKTLDQELPPRAESSGKQSLALRDDQRLEIFSPVEVRPVRSWSGQRGSVQRFVRHHPVVAGSGAFALLAGALAAILFLSPGVNDMNPSYVHLNPGQEMLEVYNSGNRLLWTLPAERVAAFMSAEEASRIRHTQVADLNGDGKNEVITGLQLSSDSMQGTPALRTFDAKGRFLFEARLGRPVSFAGNNYSAEYEPGGILIYESGGAKEIIVVANNAHSPAVITRLSATGEVLGEYWHYGMLVGLYWLESEGKIMLITCGTDDTSDTTGVWGHSKPIVIALDPAKITGRTECSFSRGFGFAPSRAELRYIVLPRSDINEALGLSCAAISMAQESDSTLRISTKSGSEGTPLVFFFVFDRALRPLDVRSSTITERMHADLVAKGKLRSTWGSGYLGDLRRQIMIVSDQDLERLDRHPLP